LKNKRETKVPKNINKTKKKKKEKKEKHLFPISKENIQQTIQ